MEIIFLFFLSVLIKKTLTTQEALIIHLMILAKVYHPPRTVPTILHTRARKTCCLSRTKTYTLLSANNPANQTKIFFLFNKMIIKLGFFTWYVLETKAFGSVYLEAGLLAVTVIF